MRPHVPHKTRSPLWRRGKWRGRLTPVRINENPVKGGTRSLLRQDVPTKPPRLNVLRWNSENNPYRGLERSVMTHCGIVSRFDLCLYYSLCGNTWKFVLQSRTLFSGVHYLLEETWRRNPPCNAEDNLRAGLVVIEAWFRGYRGSPGLGGVRLAGLYLQPDSRIMKIQDTRLHPMSGRFLPWRRRQARRADIQDLLPM